MRVAGSDLGFLVAGVVSRRQRGGFRRRRRSSDVHCGLKIPDAVDRELDGPDAVTTTSTTTSLAFAWRVRGVVDAGAGCCASNALGNEAEKRRSRTETRMRERSWRRDQGDDFPEDTPARTGVCTLT
jgi:hypothetical protein